MTEIEKAKATLRDAGYFTDHLWHVSDVQKYYKCDDAQAMNVISDTLNNAVIMRRTFDAIDSNARLNFYRVEQK